MICGDHITQDMMDKPITELSRLIGAKWFRPLEELAKEAGVGMRWITQAVRGGSIPSNIEKKLREALDNL